MDLQPLISIFGTLGGTALGAWISHSLAQSRSTNDKIWDLRQKAYSLLTYECLKATATAGSLSRGYQIDAVNWSSSERRESLSSRLADEIEQFSITLSNHILLLSSEFFSLCQEIIRTYPKIEIRSEANEAEWIGEFADKMLDLSSQLANLGKKELLLASQRY